MCLIVDANVVHRVFGTPDDPISVPIWKWLARDGKIVYGGKLAGEIVRHDAARRLLVELRRNGKAVLEDKCELKKSEQALGAEGLVRSNDLHVLALARVSGARVLVTRDGLLIKDFVDPKILRPKGRVYGKADHADLLSHRPGCRGYLDGSSRSVRQRRKRRQRG